MYLVDWSQKVPQECDVEPVPCMHGSNLELALLIIAVTSHTGLTCEVGELGDGIFKVNVAVKVLPSECVTPTILKIFLHKIHFFQWHVCRSADQSIPGPEGDVARALQGACAPKASELSDLHEARCSGCRLREVFLLG